MKLIYNSSPYFKSQGDYDPLGRALAEE